MVLDVSLPWRINKVNVPDPVSRCEISQRTLFIEPLANCPALPSLELLFMMIPLDKVSNTKAGCEDAWVEAEIAVDVAEV